MVIAAALMFCAAAAAGCFGSLLGIGGGLIIVPALTFLFGVPIQLAIAASLIGVIATSTSASARYLDVGLADRRIGLLLLIGTALGGLLGGLIGGLLDARTLNALFGLILVLVVIQMLRRGRRQGPIPGPGPGDGFDSSYLDASGREVVYRVRRPIFGLTSSVAAGSISGLLGVGGGVINVPVMNVLMEVPLRVATATSTYMLAATAVSSAFVYYARGLLDPLLAAPVALGVFLGARAGARLAPRVSQQVLRSVFIAVALIFAAQMFLRVLGFI